MICGGIVSLVGLYEGRHAEEPHYLRSISAQTVSARADAAHLFQDPPSAGFFVGVL